MVDPHFGHHFAKAASARASMHPLRSGVRGASAREPGDASAAQQPLTDENEANGEQLYEKVAAFGAALARNQEAEFLAVQDELRQAQEAEQQQRDEQQLKQAPQDYRQASDAIAGSGAAGQAAAAFIAGAAAR